MPYETLTAEVLSDVFKRQPTNNQIRMYTGSGGLAMFDAAMKQAQEDFMRRADALLFGEPAIKWNLDEIMTPSEVPVEVSVHNIFAILDGIGSK